jgi:hypothetical protein
VTFARVWFWSCLAFAAFAWLMFGRTKDPWFAAAALFLSVDMFVEALAAVFPSKARRTID